MKYEASSPEDYISQLPEERKGPMTKLHHLIMDNMPEGLESGMGYGMPAYFVPKSIYPPGYHSGLYAKKELYDWFVEEYPKHAKYKLDMGKSCVRFKKVDDIPYDLIKELLGKMSVQEWINIYENAIKFK